MATTIEQLYQDILGRAPDAGGLAHWQATFGSTIDPNEIETFRAAAAPELAATGYSAPTTATMPVAAPAAPTNIVELYQQTLGRNPDPLGLTTWSGVVGSTLEPEEIARFQQAAQAELAARGTTPLPTSFDNYQTIQDYQGLLFDQAATVNLAKQIAPLFDASRSSGGVFGTQGESVGFNYDQAQQALGQNVTASDQVLLDMAQHLIRQGVTDVSQLTPEKLATLTPSYARGGFGATYTGEGGTVYEAQIDPATGKPVFFTRGVTTSDKDKILLAAALLGGGFLLGPSLLGGAGAAGAGAGLGATELAIAAAEGIIPVTAAQTATAGLTAAQLGALGAGIGLNIPAGAALTSNLLADAQFIAADATQLAAQTGGNVAAIQQNLIAAGVDPIVAATAADYAALGMSAEAIASQIAGSGVAGAGGLFTGGSAADLALGGISTVTGGSLPPGTTVPGASTTAPASTSGLPKTVTDFLTNPQNLSSLLSLLGGGAGLMGGGAGGAGNAGALPTQGIPMNTPEYYAQLQGFLNQYLPGQMPNQSQYLQSWYGSGGNVALPPAAGGSSSVVNSLFPGAVAPAPAPKAAPVVATKGVPKNAAPAPAGNYGMMQIPGSSFEIPAPSSPAYDAEAAASTTQMVNTLNQMVAEGRGSEPVYITGLSDGNAKLEAAQMLADSLGWSIDQATQHMFNMSPSEVLTTYAANYNRDMTPIT